MYKFENFVFLQKIKLILENVDDHAPKDGKWDEPLGSPEKITSSNNTARYRFNVEGDNFGDKENPCYAVNFHGNPNSIISITFTRNHSYDDQGKNVGISVFQGVLKAISEYITKLTPVKISWFPVAKTMLNSKTKEFLNQDARTKIYEGWAIRHLFPNKYVSIVQNFWVRRDVYDKIHVVQEGYPQIPDREMSLKDKNKFLEEIRDFTLKLRDKDKQSEEDRNSPIIQQQITDSEREEDERYDRQVQQFLQSPSHNPQNLKIQDIVELSGRQGIIRHFMIDDENLFAGLQFKSNERDVNFNGSFRTFNIDVLQRVRQNSFENYLHKKTRFGEI